MSSKESCTYKEGPLPMCAPLAVPMLAAQQSAEPAYESAAALAKGTLFPGLDLPFMDYIANGPVEDTPLAELMALDFVCHRPGQRRPPAVCRDVRSRQAIRHSHV